MKHFFLVGAAFGVLLISDFCLAQKQVNHRVHFADLSRSDDSSVSKSQTVDPDFGVGAPLGLPRDGVPFQIDYEIVLTVDDPEESIDYFAFTAPSGWTITAIGPAPSNVRAECVDGDPHDGVISGFSAGSAYWGGDYGGVVTAGSPPYPASLSRSGCGPFAAELNAALADTHTFSVTMTPSASGQCPGTTTGALPLCCGLGEIGGGGGPAPVGSEPYFNQMMAASDEDPDVTVFGDAWYYVALQCPPPFIVLDKFAQPASINTTDCANGFGLMPDTLTIPTPPGGSFQYCFDVLNYSDIAIADPWGETECDSVDIDDDILGDVFSEQQTIPPGALFPTVSGEFQPPPVGPCARNIAQALCATAEGSDWIDGVGVQGGISKLGVSPADTAYVCTESSLPVELVHFGAKADDRDLVLEWATASETNNAGFAVEHRLAEEAGFREIDFVEGAGTSYETRTYTYRISDPGPGRHAVRLKQIDLDGAVTFSSVLLAEVEVPGEYFLAPVYPNPFTATAQVEFAVPLAQDVVIALIDVQGRPVHTVYDGRLEANARLKATIDASGLASGTYFLRMNGERFQASETVTVAK